MNDLTNLKSFLVRESFLKHLLAAVLVIAALFLSYGNTFQHQFMLDDYVFLVGRKTLADHSLTEIWTKDNNRFYRPVVYTKLRWVNMLSGDNPVGYQIHIFVSFVIICLLFYVLLNKLLKDAALALLTSLLYAAHPVNAPFVNYKTDNCLFVIGMQLSAVFFLNYIDKRKAYWYVLSLLSFVGALLSHEISFLLPVFLFLMLYYVKGFSLKECVQACFPFVIAVLVFFFVRVNISRVISVPEIFDLGISLGQYMDLFRRTVTWYLTQLLWPNRVILVWDEPIADQTRPMMNGLFVTFFCITSLIALMKGKKSKMALGWLIFMTGFLPVIFISFVHTKDLKTAIMEPHWFGFSSIGIFLLVGSMLIRFKKVLNPLTWKTGIVLILLLSALVTRENNAFWKDELTYCRHWAEINKSNVTPLFRMLDLGTIDYGLDIDKYQTCEEIAYLGVKYYLAQDKDKAVLYNYLALRKNVDCAPSFFFFGVYNWELGDFVSAKQALEKAHRLKPDSYPVFEEIRPDLENAPEGHHSSRNNIVRRLMGLKVEGARKIVLPVCWDGILVPG